MSIPKIPIIPTLHIMRGTIKAHMRCVGQTNPQIIDPKSQVQYLKLKLKLLSYNSIKPTFNYLWFVLLACKCCKVSFIMHMIVSDNIKWRFPRNWGVQVAVFDIFWQENIIFHHFTAKNQDEIMFFFQKSSFLKSPISL